VANTLGFAAELNRLFVVQQLRSSQHGSSKHLEAQVECHFILVVAALKAMAKTKLLQEGQLVG